MSDEQPYCFDCERTHQKDHPHFIPKEKSSFAAPLGSGARCRECGKPATCYGNYEMCGEAYACDDCCGHGNEDGWCKPVLAPPNSPDQLSGDSNQKPK